MALTAIHNEVKFGVGDKIRVTQRIKEGDKQRLQIFEGMVIGIKGELGEKTFTVRRIGEAQIGIERIFQLDAPTVEKIEVVKRGTAGVRHAKLYYVRTKSTRETDKIYSRASGKNKLTSIKK